MKETVIFSENSTGRQELGSDHRYLQRLPAQADQLVQQEEQRRRYQIDVEARLLDQAVAAVDDRLLNGSTPSNPPSRVFRLLASEELTYLPECTRPRRGNA